MIYKISFSLAINTVLILLCAFVVFHLLILTQIIPFDIVWGGKLKDLAQMRRFELISIAVNIFMAVIIAIKGNYIKIKAPIKIINMVIWLFVVLFAFNTIGNLFASTLMEKVLFTPATVILALFCYRIAIEKNQQSV